METTLTMIRHGHTPWNALGRYQGNAPIPLSERGMAQAAAVAASLAGQHIDAIHSSDLKRCRMTAQWIGRVLDLEPQYDARWRETDYGDWQGLTLDEVKELDGAAYVTFSRDPFSNKVPGGESQQMLAARVLEVLSENLDEAAGKHIVIVTHGGPIREILRHYGLWEGGLPPGNASRNVLTVQGMESAEVHCLNVVEHLPESLRPDQHGTAFLVSR